MLFVKFPEILGRITSIELARVPLAPSKCPSLEWLGNPTEATVAYTTRAVHLDSTFSHARSTHALSFVPIDRCAPGANLHGA